MHALITAMALGSIALDLAVLAAISMLLRAGGRDHLIRLVRSYGLLGLFVLSTLSIVATLLLQYADLLAPCILCWWQRIFMYPIAIISLLALIKGRTLSDIADYVLALSVLGACVALYQHLLQILPSGSLVPCDSTNDCAARLVFEFGFVTIPWMALSIFALIALIAVLGRRQ